MRSQLHPPAGVSAQLVGLPVLAAQSGAAGGLAVAARWRRCWRASRPSRSCCCAAFRGDVRRALVPLAPIVLATRLVGADPVRACGCR